jgi:biotin synthase-like enzyme
LRRDNQKIGKSTHFIPQITITLSTLLHTTKICQYCPLKANKKTKMTLKKFQKDKNILINLKTEGGVEKQIRRDTIAIS